MQEHKRTNQELELKNNLKDHARKREQKYSIPNMHEWRDDEFQATSRFLFDQNFFVFNDNHVFAIARILF